MNSGASTIQGCKKPKRWSAEGWTGVYAQERGWGEQTHHREEMRAQHIVHEGPGHLARTVPAISSSTLNLCKGYVCDSMGLLVLETQRVDFTFFSPSQATVRRRDEHLWVSEYLVKARREGSSLNLVPQWWLRNFLLLRMRHNPVHSTFGHTRSDRMIQPRNVEFLTNPPSGNVPVQ